MGDFEKWKVAGVLADKIMANPQDVPAETLDAIEAIAKELGTITDV